MLANGCSNNVSPLSRDGTPGLATPAGVFMHHPWLSMALHTRSVSRGLPARSGSPESTKAPWNVPREEGPHGEDGQVGRDVCHPGICLQGRPFSGV